MKTEPVSQSIAALTRAMMALRSFGEHRFGHLLVAPHLIQPRARQQLETSGLREQRSAQSGGDMALANYLRYFDRSPARLGPEQIRGYQVYLTNERRLAPSSLVVAVSALRFLYRVTLQKRWVFDEDPEPPRTAAARFRLPVRVPQR